MAQTRAVRRSDDETETLEAELCVVGAGISGVACAVTAARLGRRVVLADSAPWVGGQAVGVPIGTIAGLYTCGPRERQTLLSPLFAEELLDHLLAREGAWPLYSLRARTLIVVYDDAELERLFEHLLCEANVTVLPGATAISVERRVDRIACVTLATRFGLVRIRAPLYIDATGDAALTWLAGAPCRESVDPVYGTQMAVLENVVLSSGEDVVAIARQAEELLRAHAAAYGLTRLESRVFLLPQRGLAILNATHLPTPLHPVAFWQAAWPARTEAARAAQILRDHYPDVFGRARLRRLGYPGIRQTRTIQGAYMLTVEDVLRGRQFPDAIARVAWPIELHDSSASYRWQPFPDGHVYTIPYRALLSPELANLLAIGRCVDAEPAALSSARVMGPCIAMGVAAAHAADLASDTQFSFRNIDLPPLQERLRRNLS